MNVCALKYIPHYPTVMSAWVYALPALRTTWIDPDKLARLLQAGHSPGETARARLSAQTIGGRDGAYRIRSCLPLCLLIFVQNLNHLHSVRPVPRRLTQRLCHHMPGILFPFFNLFFIAPV